MLVLEIILGVTIANLLADLLIALAVTWNLRRRERELEKRHREAEVRMHRVYASSEESILDKTRNGHKSRA